MQEYIEEDEIDLKELFSIMWKNKFMIAIFSLIITSFALLYVMSLPNKYSSSTTLILKEKNSVNALGGGASALAAMAGISLGGGGGGIDIAGLFKDLLGNYSFHKNIINKYSLTQVLALENIEKNFVFTMDKKEVYNFFKSTSTVKKEQDEIIFETYKQLSTMISISTNKKTGSITLSAKHSDRFLTKKLVNIYLKEMSDYIKKLDLKDIDDQVKYYDRELEEAKTLDLKSNINDLLSTLVKKKVLSLAGEYYMVKQLTKPQVAYIKDKVGPKRGLFVIIALITSIILGIFISFFREFLKTTNTKESELSF